MIALQFLMSNYFSPNIEVCERFPICRLRSIQTKTGLAILVEIAPTVAEAAQSILGPRRIALRDRTASEAMGQRPEVHGFFERRTSSIQYVVSDPATKICAIIDPVLDFDETSGATATHSADAILRYIETKRLTPRWILDTHPHADHFSAAWHLKQKTGAIMAIGEWVVAVQELWRRLYNWPDFSADGSQWDRLFADGESFQLGETMVKAMLSPGHTLASVTYIAGDAVFVHDTLFMPDSGTARADFPGGSARTLWHSIQAILALPECFRVFTGHDYQPGGRQPMWESTIGEQKRGNIHIGQAHAGSAKSEAEFVALRDARDKTLPLPRLMLFALQVNIRGGRLPDPECDGRRYFKIPLDAFHGAVRDEKKQAPEHH
jgi:glyoxylase-like metal-dependent hydrolase (beta-lactamase superfamily II)